MTIAMKTMKDRKDRLGLPQEILNEIRGTSTCPAGMDKINSLRKENEP